MCVCVCTEEEDFSVGPDLPTWEFGGREPRREGQGQGQLGVGGGAELAQGRSSLVNPVEDYSQVPRGGLLVLLETR